MFHTVTGQFTIYTDVDGVETWTLTQHNVTHGFFDYVNAVQFGRELQVAERKSWIVISTNDSEDGFRGKIWNDTDTFIKIGHGLILEPQTGWDGLKKRIFGLN